MTTGTSTGIRTGAVVFNRAICREHYRLRFRVEGFPEALAGQFVHVCPVARTQGGFVAVDGTMPLLRRAYSVSRQERGGDGAALIDIIYRVVGTGTRWLETLREGNELSVLGPQGNAFPIDADKRRAVLVGGGVGLPPMLMLAEALSRAGMETVALCGAQSADLLALSLDEAVPPSMDAREATLSALEFAEYAARVVLSTDDGSLAFHGHVGSALEAFHAAAKLRADDTVVYTCGPERMMEFVARFCEREGLACFVCMERAMACGTGMCQSCVVPLSEESGDWRYALCCTEGPIFPAERVLWESPAG